MELILNYVITLSCEYVEFVTDMPCADQNVAHLLLAIPNIPFSSYYHFCCREIYALSCRQHMKTQAIIGNFVCIFPVYEHICKVWIC